MRETITGWLRMAVIVVLCLVASMLVGAHLARAVANETQTSEAQNKQPQNPEPHNGDLPTVNLPDRGLAADIDPMDAVLDWLDTTQSLRAEFIQQGPDGARARGNMYLERPGKIRFEYEPSVPILIVSDGEVLRFIDYEVNQVTPLPIKETPLALLLEPRQNLLNQIDVVEADAGPLAGTLAVTARDPDHPEYGTLTLVFEQTGERAKNLTLRAWQVLDAQGQITVVTLGEQASNIAMEKSLFEFEDPRRGPVTRRRRG